MKLICFPVPFTKQNMKKEVKKLQDSIDMKVKENYKLLNRIEEKNAMIKGLETTISSMKADQEKCKRLEAELSEVQNLSDSLTAQLSEIQEKMKVKLTFNVDFLQGSLKYIAISVSALTVVLVIRKIL